MIAVKKLKGAVTFAVAALFIYCLANSKEVAEASGKYLSLCGTAVIPSLFVFSVLGATVSGSEAFVSLCNAIPFWGTEAAVLLLGFCGGVPLGALTALELYRSGSISKRQGEYLCTFSTVPSVSFILSYTSEALGSRKAGFKLLMMTLAAAVLTAAVFKPIMLKKEERKIRPALKVKGKSFSEIIASSAVSTVIICGCVVFFGSLSAMLPNDTGGFLELSVGIANSKSISRSACLLGFSGVSIMCQVSAVCKGELNNAYLVAAKLFQGAVMGTIARFL